MSASPIDRVLARARFEYRTYSSEDIGAAEQRIAARLARPAPARRPVRGQRHDLRRLVPILWRSPHVAGGGLLGRVGPSRLEAFPLPAL